MKFLNMKKLTFVFVSTVMMIGCGGGSSDSTTSTTTPSAKETKDIQVVSVEALEPSGAVVSSLAKLEGKDELVLRVTLKNIGTETINTSTDVYKYTLTVTDYNDATNLVTKNVTITNLSSLKVNETITVDISTARKLKNTDKTYEFIFNDNKLGTNTFNETDYANNKKAVKNVIFEDVDLYINNVGFVENSTPITTPFTASSFNISLEYGHYAVIKSNSSFNFYGDISLSTTNAPFHQNGVSNYNTIKKDIELKSSNTSGIQINVYSITTSPIIGTYSTVFNTNFTDTDNTNNSFTYANVIN